MKIRDEHLYHGAALTQIAEHSSFTAINGIRTSKGLHRSAFRINDGIGIYLKYATKPTPSMKEYVFTFTAGHLSDLLKLSESMPKLFLCLVCVKDGEICSLPYSELQAMIGERRRRVIGEDAYTVLVRIDDGKRLKAYMNVPGTRGKTLPQRKISRSAFPDNLFE